VGTKKIHDAVVRTAIDLGVPFRDNLVIDTGEAHRVAEAAAAAAAGISPLQDGTAASSSPYVYPPPLMGRLDDPFFGFVPPLVSFPPWWIRPAQSEAMVKPRPVPDEARGATGSRASASGVNAGAKGGWQPLEVDPVKGQIEVSVDVLGQVFLRGLVSSEEAGREIEEAARSVPGVTRVFSEFQVPPRRAEGEVPPPPPPQPIVEPAPLERRNPSLEGPAPSIVPARAKPAARGPAGLDSQNLTRRVVGSLERRPQSAELPVKVRSGDGIVTISGRVPSAYEAMLVYRAAQQTPGVNEVVDRLEFAVPDENNANPLVQKGRPEDIEPYLAAQIRRHIGDLAHLDRIQARGDLIELRGTLLHAEDQDRLAAILRSIPVLHGFRLEPEFRAE
jgi:hypothetical protein